MIRSVPPLFTSGTTQTLAKNRTLARPVLSGVCGLALILACPAFSGAEKVPSPRFDPAKFWRSADLKEGMTGYGLTVFQGVQIEKFEIQVLGVLRNEYSETDLVLAKCSGGPLAKTGVIAGMSGSPIYIDNKLVGALAYAWPYSTEAIAGITPIENMLPVMDYPASERAPSATLGGGSLGASASPETNSTPADWSERFASFVRKDYLGALSGASVKASHPEGARVLRPDEVWTEWWSEPLGGPLRIGSLGGWSPLTIPLSMSGAPGMVSERLSGWLAPMGFAPVVGGAPGAEAGIQAKLEPGAALGVAMVTGDLNLTGIGTVTYTDGDRVIGFGHPMFMDGPTDLPLTTAYINTILPSSRLSTKVGGFIDIVGALEQDRQPAVGGLIGGKPATVPFNVRIWNPAAGIDRQFHYELAHHRFFTSRFGMLCVLDAFDVSARSFRDSTANYTLSVKLKGLPEVVVRDEVSSAMGNSFDLAMTLSAVLDLLLRNPYKTVQVESIRLEVEVVDLLRQGTLEWVRVDNPDVRPGDTLQVSVGIQPFLGELQVVRHSLKLPKEMESGMHQLVVTDAQGYIFELLGRNPDRYRSRGLEHMISLMNEVYRNDQLYFSLSSIAPGASFNGKEMPDLPTSVLRVMADSSERGTGMFVLLQPVVESRIDFDNPLTGRFPILVNVQPRQDRRIN
ncbi:MAG: hypothetical protein GHCLOJNM_03816 [bacterium]|nr:hypothetical protein [bacterium]